MEKNLTVWRKMRHIIHKCYNVSVLLYHHQVFKGHIKY